MDSLKKFTNDAGPRRFKRAEELLQAIHRTSREHVEVTGTVGGIEDRCVLWSPFSGPENAAALKVLLRIGERFAWTATVKNLAELEKELEAGLREATEARPVIDRRRTQEEAAEIAARMAANGKAEAERGKAGDEKIRAILAKRPRNAAALIVAELDQDDCEIQTDYFAHHATRTVAIGWRTGKREDFRQLRRAAEGFEPTRHLGPDKDLIHAYAHGAKPEPNRWTERHAFRDDSYQERVFETEEAARAAVAEAIAEDEREAAAMVPGGPGRLVEFGYYARTFGYDLHRESVEHRDNYSMGSGNYLKAGGTHSSGWRVRSIPLKDDGTLPDWSRWSFDNAEDAIPGPDVPAPSSAISRAFGPLVGGSNAGSNGGSNETASEAAGSWTVSESRNKRGPFFLVTGPRVERVVFETYRDLAEDLGGWYSRAWAGTPGGYGFPTREKAEAFVLHVGGSVNSAKGAEVSA